jgi:hypothetical protein
MLRIGAARPPRRTRAQQRSRSRVCRWACSVLNAPPMKTSMDTLAIMQNHYPERLGCAILFAPPKLFQVFWAVVHPFLDARTAAKIHFVDVATQHGRDELASLFGPALAKLDKSLGGSAVQPWDFPAFTAWVTAAEEEAKRAEAAAAAEDSRRASDVVTASAG